MMKTQTVTQDFTLLIDGPAGKLELSLPESLIEKPQAWGIVCHPHPLHGGTMHNKVVTTLAKTFQQLGVNTLRFQFRGVGKSEGQFDDGRGEVEDLLAVINWLQTRRGEQPLWLGGFSFGAYVAIKAAMQLPIKQLVTVAPPIEHFPLEGLPPITCPWVVVQGEKDEVISAEKVLNWAESQNPSPIILRFPNTGHFFHGELVNLRTRLVEALAQVPR
jgi:alpha/beta superfamily hydrolase